MSVKSRIKLFAESQGLTISAFEQSIGVSNGYVNSISKSIGLEKLRRIIEKYPNLNLEWLLTDSQQMLNEKEIIEHSKKNNLIPLYDDVESIGGNNYVAEMGGVSMSTEYIDAGGWFPDVSEAIRHYNDSMNEYPSGCILALKRIHETSNIIWGCNYVIETREIRVTKRLQTADDENYVMAYSTNTETYPDGRLIHEPLAILKTDIVRLFLVLGRVVKEYSSGPVYTKNGNKNY